jgi:hypothetical protein
MFDSHTVAFRDFAAADTAAEGALRGLELAPGPENVEPSLTIQNKQLNKNLYSDNLLNSI